MESVAALVMNETVTVLTLGDRDAWESVYRDMGLPSHSWHYAWGLAAEGYEPRLAVVRAGGAVMILPFHVRPWRGHADMATLPGLSGALLQPESRAPLELWRQHAWAQGWVTGYIQLSTRNAGLDAPPGDRIAAHNELFEFDLADWDIGRSVRNKARNTLTKGDRIGARLIQEKDRLHEAFSGLFGPAMERFGAHGFSARAIERWFADPDTLVYGAEVDGRIEAVELGRSNGLCAEMHLAALSPAGRPLHAWLLWKAAEDLQGRAVRYFNIGGYGSPGDGIDFMKRRFNTPVFPLRSVRQVYRPDVFARLCRDAGADPEMTRFPPYRFAGGTKD